MLRIPGVIFFWNSIDLEKREMFLEFLIASFYLESMNDLIIHDHFRNVKIDLDHFQNIWVYLDHFQNIHIDLDHF